MRWHGFQNYALFSHDSGEKFVFSPRSERFAKKRTRDWVGRVGHGSDDRLYGSASSTFGGQQQRITFGALLFFEPQLVLMDEPLVPWISNCVSTCSMK